MTKTNNKKQKQTDYKYSKLDNIDKAIIKDKIEFPAIKNTELAKKYGLSNSRICIRLTKQKVKDAIAEAQKTALDLLTDAQAEASRVLIKQLKSTDKRIAQGSAKEILKGVLSEKVDINLPQLPEVIEIVDVGTGKK